MPLRPLEYHGDPIIIEDIPVYVADDGRIHFVANGRIDTDGSGSSHGDKWHLHDTSLHVDGKPLNADEDFYIVLPPQIINAVKPIVLGCQARVKNRLNGKVFPAVVGDVGPKRRLGELSWSLANALGLDPNPNTGGVDHLVIEYDVFPGVPAEVNGKTYPLQAS